MHIIEAKAKLYEKIKHHDCVKGVGLQDEKTIVIVLSRMDTDVLHEIPMFYEGFRVYHKVQGDTQKKPEMKKKSSDSGIKSQTEGKISGKKLSDL
jgi:hypothetical protein